MNPNERANALRITATDGMHGTGMGFVALLTVMPLLFDQLGAGKLEVGLLSGVGMSGFILGQPIGLLVLGRRRRNKRFFVRWVLCGWAGIHLAMAVVVYLLAADVPVVCRRLLLGMCAVVTFGDGMILPIWIDWQGRLFSKASRGRAMGMIAGAWALGQATGSLLAGGVKARAPFPFDYTLLFGFAAVMFATSTLGIRSVREPASVANDTESFEWADLWGFMRTSLAQANFRSYMVARVLLIIGAGATALYSLHFTGYLGGGLEPALVIRLGALTAFFQFAFSNVLGPMGDRTGHKRAVEIGSLAQLVAIAVAVIWRGPIACGACFAILGITWSSTWVSHNNMLFETCPHGHRISHIALSNALLGPFALLAPFATGWLMDRYGTQVGIALTLCPTALGVLWLVLMVKEPRKAEAPQGADGSDAS